MEVWNDLFQPRSYMHMLSSEGVMVFRDRSDFLETLRVMISLPDLWTWVWEIFAFLQASQMHWPSILFCVWEFPAISSGQSHGRANPSGSLLSGSVVAWNLQLWKSRRCCWNPGDPWSCAYHLRRSTLEIFHGGDLAFGLMNSLLAL